MVRERREALRAPWVFMCGIGLLLLLGLYGVFLAPGVARAQRPLVSDKVGAGVIAAVQSEGSVRVMVALVEPPGVGAASQEMSAVTREVAVVQNSVLATMDSSEFVVTHQYQAVPALAGEVLTPDALARLAANPLVVRVDLDLGGTGMLTESVPLIGATSWHAVGNTGAGVVIAVLDSGVDTDHPDLAGAIVHQACFLDQDGTIDGVGFCPNGSDRQVGPGAAEDDFGHGTHVTGIAASRGNVSGAGVAPGASVEAIKVLDNSNTFYFVSEIIAALDYLITDRPDVRVVNMSLGTFATYPGDCDNASATTIAGAAAIDLLRGRGTVTFAASGNFSLSDRMAFPACLRNVISVGSTSKSDVIAASSNSNASTDILAPGVNIISSALGGGVTTFSGTSMASPHAAGCAALLIASQEAVTPDEIEARLEDSSVRITDGRNGLTFPRIECNVRAMNGVALEGAPSALAGASTPFIATITPITATQPVIYRWQASGLAPVTSTRGISSAVAFTWYTPGTQVVTVTAQNAAGAFSDVHVIEITPLPLTEVSISGQAAGLAGDILPYTARATFGTAIPVTYTWQATDQTGLVRSGGASDTVALIWSTPGTKTITVTAENATGRAVDVYQVVITPSPVAAVGIGGPTTGRTLNQVLFTADALPMTATLPISYTWQASEQTPVAGTGGLSSTVGFVWSTPGTKTITVTAQNVAGTASAIHQIAVQPTPLGGVDLSGPVRGMSGGADVFEAAAYPAQATLPVTFTWQAGAQAPVVRTLDRLSDTLVITWGVAGPQTVTVRAVNAGAAVSATVAIQVDGRIYLPSVQR